MLPESIRESLGRLVVRGDRRSPLVFVGREAELAHLNEVVEAAVDGDPPLQTNVRVVQGAPGMGKTALCEEFMRRTAARGERDGHQVICAPLHPSDLSTPPLTLVKAISERINDAKGECVPRLRKKVMDATKGGVQAVQNFFRSEGWAELKNKRHGLSDSSTLESCLDAFAQYVWAEGLAIILMLDEAQNCDVNSQQVKNNAQAIYNGRHRARMPLLCFGLPDTTQVLDQLKISRIPVQSVWDIGLLKPGEGREVIERTLDHAGLSEANDDWMAHVKSMSMAAGEWRAWREALVDGLDEESDNFPQHLTSGVIATCKGVLKLVDGRKPDEALMRGIKAMHRDGKREYYNGRLRSPALTNHRAAFGAICRLAEKSGNGLVRWDDALDIVAAGRQATVEDADDILKAAISKGVLGCDDNDDPDCIAPPPIPSMQTHLGRRYDQMLALGQRNALNMQGIIDGLALDSANDGGGCP